MRHSSVDDDNLSTCHTRWEFFLSQIATFSQFQIHLNVTHGANIYIYTVAREKSIIINFLRWNDVPRTSRIFCPKIASIFSVFSIFKYNSGKTNNEFLTSRFSYRRVRKEKKAVLLYTVRSLVMVRAISCQREGLNTRWHGGFLFFVGKLSRADVANAWKSRVPWKT